MFATVGPPTSRLFILIETRSSRRYVLFIRQAERHCARCHAIGPEGESSHEDAPAFRAFGQNWPIESLGEALAEGIVVGHPDMPEFMFEPDEISHLLAYLATLQ